MRSVMGSTMGSFVSLSSLTDILSAPVAFLGFYGNIVSTTLLLRSCRCLWYDS